MSSRAPFISAPWVLLMAALSLTSCRRGEPLLYGPEHFALAKNVWMIPAARGAHELRVAVDGSIIAGRGARTSWVDPNTNLILAEVSGVAISNRPWPTKYLSIRGHVVTKEVDGLTRTANIDTDFILRSPRETDDAPIAVPVAPELSPQFVAAFEVPGDAAVLVVKYVEVGDESSERLAFVRFRLVDGVVTATRTLDLPGVLSPHDPYTYIPQAVLDASGRKILVASGSKDSPKGNVFALDTASLEVAWRHETPAIDEPGYAPSYKPGILLAGNDRYVVAYVGKLKVERGVDPNSLYVLDAATGNEVRSFHHLVKRSHLHGAIRRFDLIDDDTLTVHAETNSRDFPRDTMSLVNVNLNTGEAKTWFEPARKYHYREEGFYVDTSAWDTRRRGYWVVPSTLHPLREIGVKLPAHLDGQ